ncbi:hypothetical protein D9615_008979 [Tricholomella constricta]|uniref:Uncharacterized protein n=1 Tax=Tricholomella constricta TaxID=117010 RepID=A0A8H5H0Y4_9AGAR|nr:hypothetical protein D9615_008979 [Tricholomella constricta]
MLNRNGKREAEAGSFEPYLCILRESDKLIFQSVSAKRPNWRVQTRILLEDYGWPLHQFRDLSELVLVVLHAAQDDGCQAKHSYPGKAAPNPVAYKAVQLYLKLRANKACTDDAALALEFVDGAWYNYYEAILKLNPQLAEKDLIMSGDLGFLEKVRKMIRVTRPSLIVDDIQIHEPDYGTHKSQLRSSSATLPFASSEEANTPQDVVHDIIHDLEALFWDLGESVEQNYSLTSWRNIPTPTQDLRRINYYLFSSEDQTELAHYKSMLFQFTEYESHVVPRFYLYFEPLKAVMKQWWHILLTAYRYPIFEVAHDWIITALKDASQALKGQAPIITPEETREVEEFRKEDLSDLGFVTSLHNDDDGRPIWDTDMSPTPSNLNGTSSKGNYKRNQNPRKSRLQHHLRKDPGPPWSWTLHNGMPMNDRRRPRLRPFKHKKFKRELLQTIGYFLPCLSTAYQCIFHFATTFDPT